VEYNDKPAARKKDIPYTQLTQLTCGISRWPDIPDPFHAARRTMIMTTKTLSSLAQAATEMPSVALAHPPARDNPVIADLVTRAAKGDKHAWDALVERYIPLIWSICRKHRLGQADAEDVGQNVWLQLFDQLGKIRDPAALPGWLATVTRRECLRVTGAAQRRPVASYVIDAEIIADERSETAEQELLAAERHAALHEAFAALPPSGQQLIALLLEDPPASYTEISARLGIPVGSIGPTRRRCLDKLRRYPTVAALINTDTSSANEMKPGSLATMPSVNAG
jgi:RNA polymerase sigma factor (sigma-70 family)